MVVLLAAVARAQTAAGPPAPAPVPTTSPAAPLPAAEFRDGHWQPIQTVVTAAAPAPVSDPGLDHAQQLLNAKDPAAALTVCLYWIKTHDNKAPGRDRAIFLIAQAKFANDAWDDRFFSFYYCDELLDEYPDSKYYFDALNLQYKIADEYLAGKKQYFFWFPIVPADDEAIEMLYRIQIRVPGSALAERCLLRTADFYYAHGDYALAHDAYGYFIKNFPRAPQVPQAKLRQAFASLAQFRGVRFDPTSLLNARTELTDFASAYPEMAAKENVAGIIVRIDRALARKLFVTAEYYRDTRAYHGAVYMYRYLILNYPNAADVPAARRELAKMPKDALADPEPKPGSDFVPPNDALQPGGGGK